MSSSLRRPTATTPGDEREQLSVMSGFYDAIMELKKLTAAIGTTLAIATFITQTPNADLKASQALSQFSPGGLLKVGNGDGVIAIATPGTDYLPVPAFTAGSVIFWSSTGLAQDNANLFFNDTTNRLGVGTSSPHATLDVHGVLTLGPNSVGIEPSLRTHDLFANWAEMDVYPNSGTNIGTELAVIPRGTGYSAAVKCQLTVYNTDFQADGTNLELFGFRAAGSTGFIMGTGAGGSGSARNLMIAAGWFTDGATNANQILVRTDGYVEFGKSDLLFTVAATQSLIKSGGGDLNLSNNGGFVTFPDNNVKFSAAGDQIIDKRNGGNLWIGTAINTSLKFYTNNSATPRLEITGGAACTFSAATTIGFFGATAAAKQTSGANLTNNVTSGGTNDQIDNWTDLTTYATDAAAIRNAVYQLARKLKQINDGLRTYGLFT